jgi:hypothetical protein
VGFHNAAPWSLTSSDWWSGAHLWGSRSPPESVTCGDRQPGMIADVSLRLLYLIFACLVSGLMLLPRASSSKNIELVGARNSRTVADLALAAEGAGA